jgi:hypothetical protein
MREEIDRLYLLVGRIATDFSSIESLWYLIFTCLIHQTPRAATDAIFQQVMGGHQQRKLIVAVAKAVLSPADALLESIIKLAVQTSKAAERRNAAIHSIIHIAEYAVPPHIAAMGISRRSPLADKDISAELADLYRTVASLELDVAELRFGCDQIQREGA